MADLDNATKFKLESILEMSGGYVLDFSNATFADFVRTSVGLNPYEKYGDDLSKARLLRLIWEQEPNSSVAKLNLDLLEHWRVSKLLADQVPSSAQEMLRQKLVEHFTQQAEVDPAQSTAGAAPVTFTTEASVTANKIEIEIHEDIYGHLGQYLATGDYFHAVEESYKLVREKLREITGKERATDAFAAANIERIFGHQPRTDAEKDFFEGVKFLNMSIQFLRNEKAHTPATPLEHNLAIHYISLASLAYDLITRYVSEETIKEIEELILAKRRSYRSASAFYRDFENGRWLQSLTLPVNMDSASIRKVLKRKWLEDADFTRSWDHSNVVLMQLELVAVELTSDDIDELLDRPTRDAYGNNQSAGMSPFLEFIGQEASREAVSKGEGLGGHGQRATRTAHWTARPRWSCQISGFGRASLHAFAIRPVSLDRLHAHAARCVADRRSCPGASGLSEGPRWAVSTRVRRRSPTRLSRSRRAS